MIRKYSKKDHSILIELLRRNTPEYFDHSEENDFKNYLNNEVEDYFVFEENQQILGCGGINYFPKEKLARISWDIIDPNFQGKGIGKKLAEYRLNYLKRNFEIATVVVRTSQLAYRFYEKLGFELEFVIKDYWAENFDLYQMKLKNKQ
ncbi:MAG TPA: GNAT family N-acetyltransferase [Xanthomarina sp.]|nr:GNAT family N-acetyltransferase [Xanthomarina sp.]